MTLKVNNAAGKLWLACLLLLAVSSLFCQFSGGTGTVDDPFLVGDVSDLNNIRNYLSYHYKQIANINLDVPPFNQGTGWVPIGTWVYYNDPQNVPFTGSYNGNGYLISNLFIDNSANPTKALFGFTQNAWLFGVALRNIYVNCNFRGAGLVAYSYNSDLEKCTVTGRVTGTGNSLGMLVAVSELTNIHQCAADGVMDGDADMVGGLVGFNKYPATISNSFTTGQISGDENVGGLIGYNMSQAGLISSYSSADVSGRNYVGGLVGVSYSSCTYSDSYALGTVTGTNYAGGLIGFAATSTLSNCYSVGRVTASVAYGGLVGSHTQSTASSCYWNTETSELTNSALGEGRTTDNMVYPFASDTYMGWDFTYTWTYDAEGLINGGYPFLNNMTVVSSEQTALPRPDLMLSSYPNPFRTSAIIGFSLPKSSEASLEIFNLKGQKIRTLHSALLAKGEHSFAWDGKTDKGEPLPGGIYLCRLKGNGFSSVRKLTLMK